MNANELYEGWDDDVTGPYSRIPRTRVLVAEDDARLREMIASRLRNDGYDVLAARSGHEALAMMKVIAEHEFDDLELLIMDIRMPGLSGLEVVYTLRAWKWETPILLITAYPEPGVVAEARRLGVGLLAKPFAFHSLSDAAVDAMQSQRDAQA